MPDEPTPGQNSVPKSEAVESAPESVDSERTRFSRKVSWALDECVRIPGLGVRFGLDPILGLIPYGGETAATMIGATILGEAGKKGLPVKTLVKMSGNMLLNATVGVIPVLGDLFSVWFKSNSRNYRLLNSFLESDEGSEASGGWWPLFIVVGSIGIVLVLNFLSWVFLTALFLWIFRSFGGA